MVDFKISEESSAESLLARKLCLNEHFTSLGLCKKTETCAVKCTAPQTRLFCRFSQFCRFECPSAC